MYYYRNVVDVLIYVLICIIIIKMFGKNKNNFNILLKHYILGDLQRMLSNGLQ